MQLTESVKACLWNIRLNSEPAEYETGLFSAAWVFSNGKALASVACCHSPYTSEAEQKPNK